MRVLEWIAAGVGAWFVVQVPLAVVVGKYLARRSQALEAADETLLAPGT